MSYFMMVASWDVPALDPLPEDVHLVPLARTQEYVQSFVNQKLPQLASYPRDHIFLVADETGVTSSEIVSQSQDMMHMHRCSFEQTRLGELIRGFLSRQLAVCIWWANPEVEIRWTTDSGVFEKFVLDQLLSHGDIAAGYLSVTRWTSAIS